MKDDCAFKVRAGVLCLRPSGVYRFRLRGFRGGRRRCWPAGPK